MSALADRVTSFLGRWNLAGTSGIVAVSGGPDSVALACLAVQLRDLGHLATIHLAHLNHQLRGCESDGDEDFVANLGERLKTPVIRARRDVGQRAREAGANLEDTARRTRYAWLDEVARQQNAAWIATGHTADDQAETVLHHILRGSGLAGLGGIAPIRHVSVDSEAQRVERATSCPWLIRPLLTSRRAEIVAYLQGQSIEPRIDSSNSDLSLTRNRLRHEWLPRLERDFNPNLIDALCRLGQQAGECQAAVTARAQDCLAAVERPRAGSMIVLDRHGFETLDRYWTREVFRLIWRREGWPAGAMTFSDWELLAAIAQGELPRHDFPAGIRAQATRHVVQVWREG